MTDDPKPSPPDLGGLQFDKAESKDAAPRVPCGGCRQPLEDQYYTVGLAKFCPACHGQIRQHLDTGSKGARATKALVLGGLAAVFGAAIATAIVLLTSKWGFTPIGLLGIGLGYLVGVAVRRGSEGRGGRAYQFMALVLCYFAVANVYLGVGLAQWSTQAPAPATAPEAKAGESAPVKPETGPNPGSLELSPGGCLGAIAMTLLLYIGMPVLIAKEDFMTIVFLGIALWEAWRLTSGVPILGPFRLTAPGKPAGG